MSVGAANPVSWELQSPSTMFSQVGKPTEEEAAPTGTIELPVFGDFCAKGTLSLAEARRYYLVGLGRPKIRSSKSWRNATDPHARHIRQMSASTLDCKGEA